RLPTQQRQCRITTRPLLATKEGVEAIWPHPRSTFRFRTKAPANNTANREGNEATDTPVAANANILPGTTARRPKWVAEESREDLATGCEDPAPASIKEDSDESDDADGEASPRRHNPNFTHASCSTLPPLNPTNSTFNRKGVRDQAEVFSAIQAHLRHIDSKLQQGDAEGARTNISQIESLINKRFEVLLVADKAGFEAADCFQLYQSKSVLTSRSYKLAVADVAVSKRARMTYNRPTHGGGLNAGELGKKGSGQGSCQER
ncbi:unnamed protein product, partial [Closterium sp. NIES-54]